LTVTQSETLTKISLPGREIYLLGTAHISQESVQEVEENIRTIKPDRVCVEIDEQRLKNITEKQSWQSLNIFQVLREKKGFLLLANLVMSSFQKRMGKDTGVTPGEEMKKAIQVAQELEIPIELCDRNIQITLRRAWAKSSFWGKNKLLAALISSALTNEKIDEQKLSEMKKHSELDGMMAELSNYLPGVKEVLIDERDTFLGTKVYQSSGKIVLAVVGAGHVPGMIKTIEALHQGESEGDLSEISEVPKRFPWGKIIPWVITAGIIALFVNNFISGGWDRLLTNFQQWFFINGGLSALGALAALGHPVSIIAAFIAAPITSLIPAIGAGMVTGLVETLVRKPGVKDFERLQTDIESFKGFYKNRFTKVLLVMLFSTLGSAIGTFIGGALVAAT
jgi:pheromone shutdown-related protein TraB